LGQGRQAEQQACGYLQAKGLRLVDKNYRCRHGEIDLIMLDGEVLVFIEVRYRRSGLFGGALASIDMRKQRKLISTASHYLQAQGQRCAARFDVVAIDGNGQIDWVPNAFDAQ
jgi:putative endonuclease